jgi:hypothetical protein
MTARALIDTSVLLALVNNVEPRHADCRDLVETVRLPLGLTQAVLTEAFYFVAEHSRLRADTWDLVRSPVIEVIEMTVDDLPHLEALMEKYSDRPMDYADATLVRAGERLGLTTILTLDYSDFATYRMSGRKKFHILPSR